MSSNIVFTTPGRNTTYMPIDLNATKEDIFEKYARQSFSTENSWPYDSPTAGYYDIKNCSTKLILLNNQNRWSHLRGKTKEKRDPFIKDPYYDWVEKEEEMNKVRQQKQQLAPAKREADPNRHFRHSSCTYKPDYESDHPKPTKSPLTNLSRPRTTATNHEMHSHNKENISKEEQQVEEEAFRDYLMKIGKRKTGLQDKTHHKNPPDEFMTSYNLNHPQFRNGQRMFVNDLCHIYSSQPSRNAKKDQFINLFLRQKDVDKKCREQFRYHTREKFGSYLEFIRLKRPTPNLVNCGYFTPQKSTQRAKTAPISRSKSEKISTSSTEAEIESITKSKEDESKTKTSEKKHNENFKPDLTKSLSNDSLSESKKSIPNKSTHRKDSLNSSVSEHKFLETTANDYDDDFNNDDTENSKREKSPLKGNKLSDLSSDDYDK